MGVDMRHNLNSKAKNVGKAIRRQQFGLGQSEGMTNSKRKLFKVVTRNFYNSHIVLTDDPKYNEKLSTAKRDIDNSSCLILTQPDLARFVSMAKAQQKKASSGAKNPDRSKTYDSRQRFDFMCWQRTGKGQKVNATFEYVMLRDRGTWYIHHLESIANSPAGIDDYDDLDEETSFDYESEEDYEDLRLLFGD
jgi:hypothetical protein